MTWSSPICHLRSHSPVCIDFYLFIVGIGPILNKELKFIYLSDRSDHTCVFQLGISTIRVILDTQHFRIISIILCFDIFFFFWAIYHNTAYMKL